MVELRELVREKGGDLYAGGNAAVLPGPGHSRNDRSLSVRLCAESSRVVFYSFANDSVRDCMAYLGIGPTEGRQSTPAERAREKARRAHEKRVLEDRDRQICRLIWNGTQDAEGSPVEAYLWTRGLVCDGIVDIRFHAAAPRAKEAVDDKPIPTHPAMVALVRDAGGGPRALHMTFITPDGRKAFGDRSRLMFGSVRGHAVQLGRPSDGVLAVGEGIETCGAYSTLKGLPCWSCLSTAGMQNFVLPRWVRRLVIAADGDRGGMLAAATLAERAIKVCDVQIDPAPEGKDWADVLGAQR